jgi:hypothetical protein
MDIITQEMRGKPGGTAFPFRQLKRNKHSTCLSGYMKVLAEKLNDVTSSVL